jgi:hypothetical protein
MKRSALTNLNGGGLNGSGSKTTIGGSIQWIRSCRNWPETFICYLISYIWRTSRRKSKFNLDLVNNTKYLQITFRIMYNRQRRRFTPLTKRIPPQLLKEAPRQLPFDVQRHNVELIVPKNYLQSKSPTEQRRLIRNLTQVSQK